MNLSEEKTEEELLSEKLTFTAKNCWETASPEELTEINSFAEGYKNWLDLNKNAQLCIKTCVDTLIKKGFTELTDIFDKKERLQPGAKIFYNNKNKSLVCAVIGNRPLCEGVSVIGSHVDSPYIGLKLNPLYEDSGLAFMDTQYYGGIKYYQWTTIPLAMYGEVTGRDGQKKEICLGDNANDPVFTITDLLPHLSGDQLKKNASDFIDGEGLDILAGSIPYYAEKITGKVKLNILNILYEKYGITEKYFSSASISFVPVFNARDVGFDRGMIGAYGHDDKSCVYAAFQALLSLADNHHNPEKTIICFLTDKEEAGCYRPQIQNFKNFIQLLCPDNISCENVLSKSSMISADVNAAFDPNYADVYDKKNASFLGKGITFTKPETDNYTDIDFCLRIQNVFEKNKIQFQFGGWGKIGKGGGATLAQDFADLGMDVLDCGIPVLSMHSPFEVISKIDLWTAHRAFKAFFNNE